LRGRRIPKAIDPVCGMELGPGEAAARLAIEGGERFFCSDGCLRQFVAAPECYRA
jgi:YHS domain-containing protein